MSKQQPPDVAHIEVDEREGAVSPLQAWGWGDEGHGDSPLSTRLRSPSPTGSDTSPCCSPEPSTSASPPQMRVEDALPATSEPDPIQADEQVTSKPTTPSGHIRNRGGVSLMWQRAARRAAPRRGSFFKATKSSQDVQDEAFLEHIQNGDVEAMRKMLDAGQVTDAERW